MIQDERYMRFFPRLMKYEGGYVNDPDDPGGETKFGISKRAYPKLNIKELTEAVAMDIFYIDYYTPLKCSEFTDEKTAWQVFDFGVNAGMKRSAKLIQSIVNAYPDGKIGKKTLNLINGFHENYPLHIYFMSKRLMYYLNLTERNSRMRKFLKGWIFRCLEI